MDNIKKIKKKVTQEEMDFINESFIEDFDIEAELAAGTTERYEVEFEIVDKKEEK